MKLTKLALLCSMSALVASVEDLEVDGRNDILDAQAASFLDIANNFVSDKPEVSQAVALAQLVSAPANSGAAAARQTQEVWNGLTIEGRPAISFTTLGNGDCFFYCLGVTRKEVEARLRVRIALLPEGPYKQILSDYLRRETQLRDAKQSSILVAREASFDQNFVAGFCFESNERCDVELLTYIFGIQLEVYNEVYNKEETDPLKLIKVGLFNENPVLPVLRLLQSGGHTGGHFDLLAVPGTPEFEEMQARGQALKDISTFTRPGEEGRQALEERLRQEDWLWRYHQTSLSPEAHLLLEPENLVGRAVSDKAEMGSAALREVKAEYDVFQGVLSAQRAKEVERLGVILDEKDARRTLMRAQDAAFADTQTLAFIEEENAQARLAARLEEERRQEALRALREAEAVRMARQQAELEAQQKAEQEAKDATLALALANGPDTSGDEELARRLGQGQPQAAQPAASKPIPKGGRRLGGEVSEEEARGRLACAAERRDLRVQQEARDATLALELVRQLEEQVLDDQPQAAQSAVSEAAKVTRREARREELRKRQEAEEAQREREARAATAKKKPGGNDRNPKPAWRRK